VIVTALSLAAGHLAGGPSGDTRLAAAIACAARNAGLALLVASRNRAHEGIVPTVMTYLAWSAVVVTLYLASRRWAVSAGTPGNRTSTGLPA
jgi:BASS family bile acid:Na+ symporter